MEIDFFYYDNIYCSDFLKKPSFTTDAIFCADQSTAPPCMEDVHWRPTIDAAPFADRA
jgi:hypothetical protein